MKRTRTEDDDFDLVNRLLFAPAGVAMTPFPPELVKRSKTPDRILQKRGVDLAYFEMKSLHDEEPHGLRPDPLYGKRKIPGKFERHLSKAAQQFDAVDPNHDLPRLVVFLSTDGRMANYGDLRDIITGKYHIEGGEPVPLLGPLAERLAPHVDRLDVIVWIDVCTDRVQGYLHHEGRPAMTQAILALIPHLRA